MTERIYKNDRVGGDSQHEEYEFEDDEEIFKRLPLHLCLEYVPLQCILSARLTCLSFAEATDSISPKYCLKILQKSCRDRNIYLLQNKSDGTSDDIRDTNDDTDEDCERIQSTFAFASNSLSSSPTSTFDRMIKWHRLLKHIPNEFVMINSSKYGLHCQPILQYANNQYYEDNNGDGNAITYKSVSEFCQYTPCHRSKKRCIPCRFHIPLDKILNEDTKNPFKDQHKTIDFNTIYNKCTPNLPSDLKCPICQNTNRTLQLKLENYTSSSVSIRGNSATLLTYNPMDASSDGENSTGADQFHFQKYAITLICTVCKDYKVLKPASKCVSNQCEMYHSPSYNSPSEHGSASLKRTKLQAQAYITTKCVNGDCFSPVLCQSCTGKSIEPTWKSSYLFTNESMSHRSLFCNSCHKRICPSCAEKCKSRFSHKKQTVVRHCNSCKRKRQKKKKRKKESRTFKREKKSRQNKKQDRQKLGVYLDCNVVNNREEDSDESVSFHDNCMLNSRKRVEEEGWECKASDHEDMENERYCEHDEYADEDEENKEWDYYD